MQQIQITHNTDFSQGCTQPQCFPSFSHETFCHCEDRVRFLAPFFCCLVLSSCSMASFDMAISLVFVLFSCFLFFSSLWNSWMARKLRINLPQNFQVAGWSYGRCIYVYYIFIFFRRLSIAINPIQLRPRQVATSVHPK